MPKLGTVAFSGMREEYDFTVYSSDTPFNDIGAVYVFTKRVTAGGKTTHTFLYIGESGELGTRIASHEKWPCVNRNGVNAICIHQEENERTRLRVETDLRAANTTPCND